MAEIDVEIDDIGNSVIHQFSGETFATTILPWSALLLQQQDEVLGWRFDWRLELGQSAREVVALTVQGSEHVQGLMSLQTVEGYVEVHLVESAPHNVGQNKLFRGVPANLFGYACARSFKLGFGGFVAFESKTNLIAHYEYSLGARRVGTSNRMVITEESATLLLRHYLKEQDQWPL